MEPAGVGRLHLQFQRTGRRAYSKCKPHYIDGSRGSFGTHPGRILAPCSSGSPTAPRRVVVLAQEEARVLNHDYIGTEHILLGLVREGEGVAAQVLERYAANMDPVRHTVVELLSGYAQTAATAVAGTPETLMSEVVARGAVESTEGFPSCPTCRSALAETSQRRRSNSRTGTRRRS